MRKPVNCRFALDIGHFIPDMRRFGVVNLELRKHTRPGNNYTHCYTYK